VEKSWFYGGHEEVKQRLQAEVDGGQGSEFPRGSHPVVSDVFPNAYIVFLFDETVVVFFVGTAAGKVDMLVMIPFSDGFVDEFGAVIAMIF
jgi:hypothetical protein